ARTNWAPQRPRHGCALLRQLRALGRSLCARRPGRDARACAGVSARRRVATGFAGGRRRSSGLRRDAMVYRKFRRGALASRTGPGDFRSGTGPRSRLSLRPGRRRFRGGLSGDRALAARRDRSRAKARRRDGQAHRGAGTHLATSTMGLMHSVMFEVIGRNVDRAAPLVKKLSGFAHEHGIALWIAFGAFLEAWVELRSGSPETGLLNMRRAAALLQEDGVGAFQPLVR